MTTNAATMREDGVDLKTATGFRLHVRPVAPDDDEALSDLFENVTKDDLRFRFLSAIQKVSDKQIAEMTHVDHRQTEDFMIYSAGGDHLIANAILAADKMMDTAEFAISVHSEFKDQGIEKTVLEFVAQNAKARGIKKLQSFENRENHCAIELERRMGYTARGVEGDPMLVLLEQRL